LWTQSDQISFKLLTITRAADKHPLHSSHSSTPNHQHISLDIRNLTNINLSCPIPCRLAPHADHLSAQLHERELPCPTIPWHTRILSKRDYLLDQFVGSSFALLVNLVILHAQIDRGRFDQRRRRIEGTNVQEDDLIFLWLDQVVCCPVESCRRLEGDGYKPC
jgi:hypothetical protein